LILFILVILTRMSSSSTATATTAEAKIESKDSELAAKYAALQELYRTLQEQRAVEYIDMFMKTIELQAKPVFTLPPDLVCGRLIRGREEKDFETLTCDPGRDTVFMVASEGLNAFLGKTPYQMLVEIGYGLDYIREKVESGHTFRLVMFPASIRTGCVRRATWDGVMDMVRFQYPAIAPKVAAVIDQLRGTSWEDIVKQSGGLDFGKITANHADFMTAGRLAEREGNLVNVRAFLYHIMQLRELYSGDGYTKTADGARGVPEYLAANVPLKSLGPSCRVLKLKVELPT